MPTTKLILRESGKYGAVIVDEDHLFVKLRVVLCKHCFFRLEGFESCFDLGKKKKKTRLLSHNDLTAFKNLNITLTES